MLMFENFNELNTLKSKVDNYLNDYPYIKYTLLLSDNKCIVRILNNIDEVYLKQLFGCFKYTGSGKEYFIYDLNKNLNKDIINNIEHVDLPELKIFNLLAKIDTGASTCSIDVRNIKKNGNTVTFKNANNDIITKNIEDKIIVQGSNGIKTERLLIKTKLLLKNKEFIIYLSLANREDMEYKMLIGKDVLNGFLINTNI